MRIRHIESQLSRWLEELSQFDMEIVHRSGKKHQNADGLSRIPDDAPVCDCYDAGTVPEQLPCGGCAYCHRAHSQWSRFERDVDDVLPLASKVPTLYAVRTFGASNADDSIDYDSDLEQGLMAPLSDWYTDNDPDATLPYVEDDTVVSNCVQQFTTIEIRSLQLDDPYLFPLIEWMETDYSPNDAELRLYSPATRSLWLCRPCLEIRNDVLYYRWIDKSDRDLCLVVPVGLKDEVLRCCHDCKTSGNLGQRKTIEKIKQSFIWYNLTHDCAIRPVLYTLQS